MVNLKKRRHKAICSECNGNGYKQFQIQENGKLNEDRQHRLEEIGIIFLTIPGTE